MEDNNKPKYNERFLSSPSLPEVIRVDKIQKSKHSVGEARLRLGFMSDSNEVSFDVNKILTKEMLVDLHNMIGKVIKKIDEEDTEREASDEKL